MRSLQGKNRAGFLTEIAGLSEMMVAFIKPLSPQDKQRAVAKVDDIKLFLSICNLTSATINRHQDSYNGFDCAIQMLDKDCPGTCILIEAQELEALWKKITADWWSKEFFVYLKMAIYTRLPGLIKPDPQLEEAANFIGEASAQEFRERRRASDAEVESRISDPAYWEQIRRDMKNF